MHQKINHFFIATYNILLFLVHFFSVKHLLRSLFDPWKNVKETPGQNTSLQSWMDTIFFNAISRGLGSILRGSILLAFVMCTLLYVSFLPIATLAFFLILPILQLESRIPPSEEALKQSFHDKFMKERSNEKNKQEVESWFAFYYDHFLHKKPWWSYDRLMKILPIAHDWSSGFTTHLNNFGSDLALSTRDTILIGREKELADLTSVLSKEQGANALLVGETGVGKQAIIYELARKTHEGSLTPLLNYRRYIKLDVEKMLAQYTDISQREIFFEELLKEADDAGNVILIVENIHQYTSSESGKTNLISSLQKCANNINVHLVATTTPHDFETFIRPLSGFGELFTAIQIQEPSPIQIKSITAQEALYLEFKFQVVVPYETVEECVSKSAYYISDLPFPEKAIKLLEAAVILCSQAKETRVLPLHLDLAVTNQTHAPTSIDDSMKNKLLELEQILQKQIISQDEAIKQLSTSLRRAFVMLGKRTKPLATLLFTGPTGTGKTQTAKVLTKAVFNDTGNPPKKLLRFDMSLYQSLTDISHLIGTADNREPGQLTAAVQEEPYATLLLDEIEKAHHDLLNIFLTIFDEGYFTNGGGRRIDCKHLIIIATSNVDDVETFFAPEFLNRFDGIVKFHALDNSNVLLIARTIADSIIANYSQIHHIGITVSDAFIKQVVDNQYDKRYGARDVQRIISSQIEDNIAKLILENKIKAGDTITL